MQVKPFQPAIKWSGSKRSQVGQILDFFPKEIDTYYEPFCGGASVTMGLLLSSDKIKVNRIVCSDLNNDLISLWKKIQENPQEVCDHYRKLWNWLNSNEDKAYKRSVFEEVRARFNKERNPLDFFFVMKTTTNGMPRYNGNGEFNNSFHITRDGMHPDKTEIIVKQWNRYIQGVEFRNCSYEEIEPKKGDFVYMDPPYFHTTGMYYGSISYDNFIDWLRSLECSYLFSFDGKSGNIDNTVAVPTDVYTAHHYIKSGNSSFKRVIGKDRNAMVYESLYQMQK